MTIANEMTAPIPLPLHDFRGPILERIKFGCRYITLTSEREPNSGRGTAGLYFERATPSDEIVYRRSIAQVFAPTARWLAEALVRAADRIEAEERRNPPVVPARRTADDEPQETP